MEEACYLLRDWDTIPMSKKSPIVMYDQETWVLSVPCKQISHLTFLLLKPDCYNLLSIQTCWHKSPDKPWRFLPTHQKLLQIQPPLSILFCGTNLPFFMTESLFPLDTILNRFVCERFTQGVCKKNAIQNFLIWAKIRRVIFIGQE